jgi:hypothetical protein
MFSTFSNGCCSVVWFSCLRRGTPGLSNWPRVEIQACQAREKMGEVRARCCHLSTASFRPMLESPFLGRICWPSPQVYFVSPPSFEVWVIVGCRNHTQLKQVTTRRDLCCVSCPTWSGQALASLLWCKGLGRHSFVSECVVSCSSPAIAIWDTSGWLCLSSVGGMGRLYLRVPFTPMRPCLYALCRRNRGNWKILDHGLRTLSGRLGRRVRICNILEDERVLRGYRGVTIQTGTSQG